MPCSEGERKCVNDEFCGNIVKDDTNDIVGSDCEPPMRDIVPSSLSLFADQDKVFSASGLLGPHGRNLSRPNLGSFAGNVTDSAFKGCNFVLSERKSFRDSSHAISTWRIPRKTYDS